MKKRNKEEIFAIITSFIIAALMWNGKSSAKIKKMDCVEITNRRKSQVGK